MIDWIRWGGYGTRGPVLSFRRGNEVCVSSFVKLVFDTEAKAVWGN